MLSDFENGIATAINADNKILISFDVLGEQFGTIDYNDQQRTFSLTTPKDSFTSVETVMDYPKIKLQYKETLPFDTTGYSISKSDTVAAGVDLSIGITMFSILFVFQVKAYQRQNRKYIFYFRLRLWIRFIWK